MFKPVPMHHVTLYLLEDDIARLTLGLANFGWFGPTDDTEPDDSFSAYPHNRFRETFNLARTRLDKILSHLELALPQSVYDTQQEVVGEEELVELSEKLGVIWRECSQCEEGQRQLQEQKHHINQLIGILSRYMRLEVDLGRLQGPHQFLDVRIGTVPVAEVERLREAIGLIDYSLTLFDSSEQNAQVVIAGLNQDPGALKRVLDTASFRQMEIPGEFRDYPQRLQQRLEEQLQEIEENERALEQRVEQGRKEYGEYLVYAARRLNLARVQAQLSQWLQAKGALVSLQGWVPAKYTQRLRAMLDSSIPQRYLMHHRDPLPEERPIVPSYTEHGRLLRPFADFVKNYGIPRYGEFDPTWLFAFSYVLMFGMMFGDIGHGLMIAGAGLVFRHKLRQFTTFVVAIGLSSAVFGFVYGSVFGYEELIHPLWMSPLADPILMLQLALVWGVIFIALTTLLTVHNYWVEGEKRAAIWEGKGLLGLVLYLALLFGGWQYLVHERFGTLELSLIALPLAAITYHSWRHVEAPLGERLLVVFIEAFETVMSYITNTLSFLRVAAFSLNHVALIIAVFTLANMLGQAGHWITVVLGNLFVLVLEGAIVAIQVLRLEYYEGFSRFYRGDGVPFRPLHLGPAQSSSAN